MNLHDICSINESVTDKRAFKELNVVMRQFLKADKTRVKEHTSTEAMIIKTKHELEEIKDRVDDMLLRIERGNY